MCFYASAPVPASYYLRSPADGGGGGSAPPPRKRAKASAQAAAHDLQQQSQQEAYDPSRLAQQVTSPGVRALPCAARCAHVCSAGCALPETAHALTPELLLSMLNGGALPLQCQICQAYSIFSKPFAISRLLSCWPIVFLQGSFPGVSSSCKASKGV